MPALKIGTRAAMQTAMHTTPHTAMQNVTPELRQWIIEQAQAGCRPEDVLASMKASGWDEAVALAALEHTLAQFVAGQSAAPARALPPPVRVPEPALADRSEERR